MSYTGFMVAIDKENKGWAWGQNITDFIGSVNNRIPNIIFDDLKTIAASGNHILKVSTDNVLMGRGSNTFGQLGQGHNSTVDGWVEIMRDVEKVDAEMNVSACITKDGELYVFGRNYYNIFGPGSSNVTTPLLLDVDVKDVRMDSQHMIWLKKDGTVRTMGRNATGQIGNGTSGSTNQSTPYAVPGLSNIIEVKAGIYCSMALSENGDLFSWGSNSGGRNGHLGYYKSPELLMSGVKRSFMSYMIMGALTESGDLYVSGLNAYGQLGVGTTENVLSPTFVLSGVQGFQIANNVTSVLMEDGSIRTAGSNLYGALGVDASGDSSYFIENGLTNIKAMLGVDEVKKMQRFLVEVEGGFHYYDQDIWNLID